MNSPELALTIDTNSSCSVGTLSHDDWHKILDEFNDASVFQTVPFCTARGGSRGCEHLVVTRGRTVVAAAQVRIMSMPLTRSSIAYVIAGPMFDRRDSGRDWSAFRQAIRALRDEYVVRRAFNLRINSLLTQDDEHECVPKFREESYELVEPKIAKRTIIMDIAPPLDDLRKKLEQKWRNQLNRAEKNELEVVEGHDDALFEPFLHVYRQMLSRKRITEGSDIRGFRAMQAALPQQFKLRLIVVLDKGEPSAGAIVTAIGRRGTYLFGATAETGMKNKASYLAQWRAIQWIKERRCTEYDLHGVNAEANPGVYKFKTGLCGKNGKEVDLLGNFEAYSGARGKAIMTAAEHANRLYKAAKDIYGRYRGFQG